MSITLLRRCNQSSRPSASSASGRSVSPSSFAACRRSCDTELMRSWAAGRRRTCVPSTARGKGPRESDEALNCYILGSRGRLDPRGVEQRGWIGAQRFQALTQHLAALTERGLSHPLERGAFADERIVARHQVHDRRCHVWWRHEGAAGDVEADARFATPANEDGQPSEALAAGGGDDAFGNLALEHQPADQQRSGNVVGQVRNHARGGLAEERTRIEAERIAGNNVEASRISPGDLVERRDRAIVALDRDHPARACSEKRTGEPTRPGTDLHDVHARKRIRRAGDARGEVEVEKKVLAERLLGSETVSAYHLAERRKIIDGAHARSATGREWDRDESLAAS